MVTNTTQKATTEKNVFMIYFFQSLSNAEKYVKLDKTNCRKQRNETESQIYIFLCVVKPHPLSIYAPIENPTSQLLCSLLLLMLLQAA
jgi:hypothetical protein